MAEDIVYIDTHPLCFCFSGEQELVEGLKYFAKTKSKLFIV